MNLPLSKKPQRRKSTTQQQAKVENSNALQCGPPPLNQSVRHDNMKMKCAFRCSCASSLSSSGVMALVFTLTHAFSVVTASPEDWPSGPPFGHVEDPGVFTKAFINVTKEEEGEWKSQVDELGRLVACVFCVG